MVVAVYLDVVLRGLYVEVFRPVELLEEQAFMALRTPQSILRTHRSLHLGRLSWTGATRAPVLILLLLVKALLYDVSSLGLLVLLGAAVEEQLGHGTAPVELLNGNFKLGWFYQNVLLLSIWLVKIFLIIGMLHYDCFCLL